MHNRIINISAFLLIVVGVGGYLLSGRVSPTALIPAVIGVALLVAEALGSRRTSLLSQIWVPLLAIIGLSGTLRGISALISELAGSSGLTLPTVGRSFTAIACAIILATAIIRWRQVRSG